MSDFGSGQYAGYSPPPPPRPASKSPWLYISLGCGMMILLLFGGCVAVGVVFTNKMKASMKTPLNATEINATLGDTPRYPNATLNIPMSKAMRVPMGMFNVMFGSASGGGAVFATSDSFPTVKVWYDGKLQAGGYTPTKSQGKLFMFHKEAEMIGLQDVPSSKNGHPGTSFLLMRFHNAKRLMDGR